ncbi:MAG: hypothetical protein ABSH03_17435 [Candidatus Lustribacter sp.]|jgi:hypothetical protein
MNLAQVFCFGALVALGMARAAVAGPPFVTDDPVPTDYRNWEIYTGLQYENDGSGNTAASLPFAEFNYGALPNVQVSASFELNDLDHGGAPLDGYGGTEFGIKTRFVQETSDRPQISFYPSVTIPEVAGQHAVPFLPLWMQKSWGPWSAFGGGGVYLNSSPGMRNSTFAGAALERSISAGTTVGAELYHQSSDTIGGSDTTAFNVGMIAQVGQLHAILFSVGRAFQGGDTFSAYASYEFALGPRSGR